MYSTLNRWIPKRLLLAFTVLIVTATSLCAQNWTDYSQLVPSMTFPDMGNNWTGLNDPLNSWISSPTSSLNSSWITDPGFLPSLRVEYVSILTPTISLTSGVPLTSTFDAQTQTAKQMMYPVFEQAAMARVRPQLVENQMWQELNLVNQGRLKNDLPRLSFEEYYGPSSNGSPSTSMSFPWWGQASVKTSAENIEDFRQVTRVVGFVRKVYGETHPSLAIDLGIDVIELAPDIMQDYQNIQQGSYYGWAASHTFSGGAGLLYSKLIWDVWKSRLAISRYMSGLAGLPEFVEVAGSYLGRGGRGPLSLREITLGIDAVAITFTGLAFGLRAAEAAAVGLPLEREFTMPAFQAGVNLFYNTRMAEQTRQQELNFERTNQMRIAQGKLPLSREEFLHSTPGQNVGFLNTLNTVFQTGNQAMYQMFKAFEMSRNQSQRAEQQSWLDYNRFNKEEMLSQGFGRISYDEFLNMRSLTPVNFSWERKGDGWYNSGYYSSKGWFISDPTRGITMIRTTERFKISISGGDYGWPGRF